jgi:hypothetical protein
MQSARRSAEPERAVEIAVAVGHERYRIRVLIALPGFHHVRIVDRQAQHGVDAMPAQQRLELDEAWQMLS